MVAESLFDFLETNFDGQSGLASLGSAPLLLKSCAEEKEKIVTALSSSGNVGSALAAKQQALETREAQLKEVKERKQRLAEKLQKFKGGDGGIVAQLDTLQEQVTALESKESRLRVLATVQALEAEPDPLKRLQQLSEVRPQLSSLDADARSSLQSSISTLAEKIKPSLVEELKAALKALAWPKQQEVPQQLRDEGEARLSEWITPPALPSPTPLQRFCRAAAALSTLQEAADPPRPEEHKARSSWAVQTILHALDIRFKFHFRGPRETNRVDKPEWFLTYQLDRLKEHLTFFAVVVQPTLKVAAPALASQLDAVREFAGGLVKQAADKVIGDADILIGDGALLMKTVEELLRFDTALSELLVANDTPMDTSPALAPPLPLSAIAIAAQQQLLLQRWLQMEVTCAQAHVQRLLDSPDALAVRHVVSMAGGGGGDESLRDENWGTTSSQGVMKLLEEVSERYQALPQLKDKVNFCKLVQEESIVEPYAEGLRSKRAEWMADWQLLVQQRREEASMRRQHRAARLAFGALDAVAGGVAYAAASERPKEKTVSPSDVPLRTICGIAASARYCHAVCTELADSFQFLELHQAMQGETGDAERPESQLDDAALTFSKERAACLDTVVEVVCTDFADAMEEYDTQGRTWTDDGELLRELSPEIRDAITILDAHLTTLRAGLHPVMAGTVWREVASRVDEVLFTAITKAGAKFSHAGGEQLGRDMQGVFDLFLPFTNVPRNFLKRTKEAALLLAMSAPDLRTLVAAMDHPAAHGRDDALAKAGVQRLSLEKARSVCFQRVDLNMK